MQWFPSQTPCSGKQAFVWNSGHGVQRDSGTVEQTLKALQLGWNSWEVALLLSKSSPSGWLRQGNKLGSSRGCSVVGLGRDSGAVPWSCDFPTLEGYSQWHSPGLAAGNPRECFHSVWEGTCAFSSWALMENQITKQILEETAKHCPYTTWAAPMGCQLFIHSATS